MVDLRSPAIVPGGIEDLVAQGRSAAAAQQLCDLLAIDPSNTAALINLGAVRQLQGRHATAVALCRQALIRSGDPHGWIGLARAFGGLGRLEEAVGAWRRALASIPPADVGFVAAALAGLGQALRTLGRPTEAVVHLRRSTDLDPDQPDPRIDLGGALLECGRGADAVPVLRRVVGRWPELASGHAELGAALKQTGGFGEAEEVLRRAIALGADTALIWMVLGEVLGARHDHAAAAEAFARAAVLAPDDGTPRALLAGAMLRLGRRDEALAASCDALARDPTNARFLTQHGEVLLRLGQIDAAVAIFRDAVAQASDTADTQMNVGTALVAAGRLDDGITQLRAAMARDPAAAGPRWNLALALLAQGAFAEGFAAYEARWSKETVAAPRADLGVRLWLGETPIAGRRILVAAEQGLGDLIQFVRYIKVLSDAGAAEVNLETYPELRALFANLAGLESVHCPGERRPEFDVWCPLLSLPLALGTELDTVPAAVPYLRVPEAAVARWRSLHRPPAGRQIGIVWAGNQDHVNDHNRSIPLARFRRLLDAPGCTWHILQKQLRAGEEELLATLPDVVDPRVLLRDFTDTAALIDRLDLVIGVDTSAVHLAGALGKPVWVLIGDPADWRWMLEREDSPWYPTMRLFRQRRTGDWDEVLERVRAALCGDGG